MLKQKDPALNYQAIKHHISKLYPEPDATEIFETYFLTSARYGEQVAQYWLSRLTGLKLVKSEGNWDEKENS